MLQYGYKPGFSASIASGFIFCGLEEHIRLYEMMGVRKMNNRIDTVSRARQLAAERNMPLSQLAKQCGINHSTLSVSRARGGQLQVETIYRICDVLGVTTAEFFTPTDADGNVS